MDGTLFPVPSRWNRSHYVNIANAVIVVGPGSATIGLLCLHVRRHPWRPYLGFVFFITSLGFLVHVWCVVTFSFS